MKPEGPEIRICVFGGGGGGDDGEDVEVNADEEGSGCACGEVEGIWGVVAGASDTAVVTLGVVWILLRVCLRVSAVMKLHSSSMQ